MKMPAKKDMLYVGIQFFLFAVYLIPAVLYPLHFNWIIRAGGLLVGCMGLLIVLLAILQLNKSLSPFPTPKYNGSLIQNGLYKYARHPIYSGILLATAGFAVLDQSIWKAAICLLLYVLFFFKSRYEETLLTARFNQYKSYRENTSRFFPGV